MLTIYLHLRPDHDPPALNMGAPKFIVMVDAEVSDEWRNAISDWMVDCGCLYMLAWGQDCRAWDDSVDWATLRKFDFEEIPAEKFVMTTWHEDEPLDEVFRFSKEWAKHPITPLDYTIILHISEATQQDEILKVYEAA
jgi:hypothetical protein